MRILKILLALAAFMPGIALCGNFDSLVTDSPFGAGDEVNPQSQTEGVETITHEYELTGIFVANGTRYFNIHFLDSDKFKWVDDGSSNGEIVVDAFDDNSKILHFHTRDGSKHSIRLKNFIPNLKEAGVLIK